MEFKKRQPIGIELIKRGLVTEEDVRKALLEQKKVQIENWAKL